MGCTGNPRREECLSNPYLKSVLDGGGRLDFSPTLHKMRRYKSVCHGDFMQRKKASEEGRKQVCQFRMSIGIPAAGSTNHFAPGFVVSTKALVRQAMFCFCSA